MSYKTYIGEKGYSIYKECISINEQHWLREELTVRPYIWCGFKGLDRQNLILNITNVIHDQKEVLRKNLNEIEE